MGCCGDAKVVGIAKIATKRQRCCTDILFLLAFWAAFGFLILIMVLAGKAGGDYKKQLTGVEINGQDFCGLGTYSDKPYTVWPNPLVSGITICASDCSVTTACTNTKMVYFYPSKPLMGKFCIPDVKFIADLVASSGKSSALDDINAVVQRAIGDLMATLPILGGSSGFAIVISYFFMFLLTGCAGCIVYLAIALLLAAGGALGYLLYYYGTNGASTASMTASETQACLYAAYVVWAIFGIIFLILFFLRNRIKIAVEVIKESADAVGDMKFLVFFPILPLIAVVAYLVLWVYMALTVASVRTLSTTAGVLPSNFLGSAAGYDPVTSAVCVSIGTHPWQSSPPQVYPLTQDIQWRNYGGYQFFHMLWLTQFFYYFGYLTFAGATANWYFTARVDGKKKRGSGDNELSNFPVTAAFYRTFLCHQGTVAVCSLIIAIVQFLRAIVLYMEKVASGKPPNKLQKAIFCIISCCLKCVQCCLDKLNKNGLIWTAIYGDGFFVASCSAFMLIWKNLARVAAINVVSSLIVFVIKITVALLSTAVCVGIMMAPYYKNQISSPVFPAVVCFFVSYVTAAIFMTVFSAVIDSVFLCFLVDSDQNPAGKMFASVSLQKLVGKYEKESKEKADVIKSRVVNRPGTKISPAEPTR